MLDRPRSSRIFYRGQFFAYPLKAGEALFKLGVFEAARCVLSYVKARLMPTPNPRSFEDWVTNQFGSAAVQHLLQDLHGESVGHELQGNLRRLGGPAHQGSVAVDGHPQRPLAAEESRRTRDRSSRR